jgi:glycosyltransferase involved in cell wall biosynthesis
MTYNPLISVLTPAFNHEQYIRQAIDSVIRQSYGNWELIVMDDGSSDRTADIAEEYVVCDKRIRVFRQENKGISRLSETYNKALAISSGELIAILEGDDYWEPEKLKIEAEAMLNNPDAVLCWGKAAARIGESLENHQIIPVHEKKNIEFYHNMPPGNILNSLFDDFPTPLTYLIRKEALVRIGGFIQIQPLPAVDLGTLLALSRLGPFVYVDQILGTWRISMNQVTKMYTEDLLNGSRDIYLSHYQQMNEEERKICRFDSENIVDRFNRKRIISFARSGRFKLIRRDFKGARGDYQTALLCYGFKEPVWKLRALTGWIFSFFHADVENLARWIGKGSLKEKAQKRS